MIVVGIDLGVHKITLCLIRDGEPVYGETFVARTGEERGNELAYLAICAHQFVKTVGADEVWIEDTLVGNNRKYSIQLSELLGATRAKVSDLDVKVSVVNNKTWKKFVVGNGNSNKDAIRSYVEREFPVYAVTCGDDQDQRDAACVGLYGARIAAGAGEHKLA